MRTEGITGAAIPDTRGVPLPHAVPYDHHETGRPARDPLATSPFRGQPIVEFTRDQLQAAGYQVAGAPKPKRQPRPASTSTPRDRKFDHQAAVTEYLEGASSTTLAAKYGVTAWTILKAVRSAGQQARPSSGRPAKPHTPKEPFDRATLRRFDYDATARDYQGGATVGDLAARHQVTDAAIRRVLHLKGVTLRADSAPCPRSTTPVTDIVNRYTINGETIPAIAAALRIGTRTARNALLNAGVTLRDDRATHSGGGNRHPDSVLRAAGELYQSGLTRDQVADRLGIHTRVVDKGIRLVGATPRPAAHIPGTQPGVDRAADLKELMRCNGIQSLQVRLWAATTGRDCPPVGIPPRQLVEDYLLATTPKGNIA